MAAGLGVRFFVGRLTVKGKNGPASSLLARNDAAENHKDRLRVHHHGRVMATNRQSVKQTILFVPH
jgi:hypothetical protein